MRIQNNIMAVNTHRQLGVNNLNQAKSTEKLSSGFRINRAADDAAGLTISEKMRAQVRGLTQASANAQDGISLIQAAEGALQETHSILQRMRELAVKAATDVNEAEDRDAIAAEMNQLTAEIDRIAYTTEFNKKTLLDGSLSDGMKAVGSSSKGVSDIKVAEATADGYYGYSVNQTAIQASFKFTTATAAATDDYGLDITLDDKTGTQASLKVLVSNVQSGTSQEDLAAMYRASIISALKEQKLDDMYSVEVTGNAVTITSNVKAAATNNITVATAAGTQNNITADATYNTAIRIKGQDGEVTGYNSATTTAMKIGKDGMVYDSAKNISFKVEDATRDDSRVGINVTTGKELTLQVGANTGTNQTIKLGIERLSASGLGITGLRVDSHEFAQAAVDSIEAAIQKVSQQRSDLGAVQNRLEHTTANLDTVAENIQSAESRIRDVDMAKEMMNFTKNNILNQASTAMLAQANQAPQSVLQLLG